ncbi:MAG: thiamine pyrophosphate-dependent dehydrogenase E1 component subunit alpha [Acidobacteriota bacterium]
MASKCHLVEAESAEARQIAALESAVSRDGIAGLLLEMYSTMLRIRVFEEQVAALVEAGEIKTPCHLYIGQEAVATGVCAALEVSDTIWGNHRSHGHYLAKGGDSCTMMAEIFGKKTGCCKGRGGSMHLFSKEVGILGTVPIVAGTVPLAVGAALAAKLRRDGSVSVAFFGDGTLDEGHVHESLNLAALYRLPVVFVCENNFYASHMQLLERRVKDNLHQAGEFFGVPGVREDGNDVVAVYEAARGAVERARSGDGPSLLEFRTFRWRGHVGPSWDTDVGVKRRDELKDWLPKDPIARARTRLLELGAGMEALERVENSARDDAQFAVSFARRSPYPGQDAVLDHVFACSEGGPRCEG